MPTFIASRISSGENTLFPDKLIIDASKVIFYKGSLVGYKSIVIKRYKIASVHIESGLLFADIIIESTGGAPIIARGFTKSDARQIVSILS